MGQKQLRTHIRRMTFLGMLFAMTLVLSLVESKIPSPIPPAKFGLSNIGVMYALYFLNFRSAFTLTLLKSIFAMMIRGPLAGWLSFTGGLGSILVMSGLNILFRKKPSYVLLSMCGAITHNLCQLITLQFYYGVASLKFLPFLLIMGILSGILTALLFRWASPILGNLRENTIEDINR